jgi:hypothetical protein
MKPEISIHRILGIKYIDNQEDQDHIQRQMKLAAGGAFPYEIREMMKRYAWGILRSASINDEEKENAKLLICYSWWSRALARGIPKKHFEKFMLDHLAYLDTDNPTDKGELVDAWKKYS